MKRANYYGRAAQYPWLIKSIQPEWLKRSSGFHEIETNVGATSAIERGPFRWEKLKEVREDDDDAEMTHSVAVNIYPARRGCRG